MNEYGAPVYAGKADKAPRIVEQVLCSEGQIVRLTRLSGSCCETRLTLEFGCDSFGIPRDRVLDKAPWNQIVQQRPCLILRESQTGLPAIRKRHAPRSRVISKFGYTKNIARTDIRKWAPPSCLSKVYLDEETCLDICLDDVELRTACQATEVR
ncbi:hypothetical protein BDW22DRAFT_228884 [Trametopsis cervina]|nr:hypothetical protein BDW22DRAFT_228884 [Trametopsis cervina]